MKFIVIFTVIIIASMTESKLCPHPTFVAKHLCFFCQTKTDALKFTMQRVMNKSRKESHDVVMLNTIQEGFFRVMNNNRALFCANNRPLRVMRCDQEKGSCFELGQNCFLKHNVANNGEYKNNVQC